MSFITQAGEFNVTIKPQFTWGRVNYKIIRYDRNKLQK